MKSTRVATVTINISKDELETIDQMKLIAEQLYNTLAINDVSHFGKYHREDLKEFLDILDAIKDVDGRLLSEKFESK